MSGKRYGLVMTSSIPARFASVMKNSLALPVKAIMVRRPLSSPEASSSLTFMLASRPPIKGISVYVMFRGASARVPLRLAAHADPVSSQERPSRPTEIHQAQVDVDLFLLSFAEPRDSFEAVAGDRDHMSGFRQLAMQKFLICVRNADTVGGSSAMQDTQKVSTLLVPHRARSLTGDRATLTKEIVLDYEDAQGLVHTDVRFRYLTVVC